MAASTGLAANSGRAPPPAIAPLTAAECEVWARELGFARSVAEHDAAAFASHLHPGAAFGSGQPQPLRGRDAVVAGWAHIIAGKGVSLDWYPTRVTIGDAEDVAWSSGPALFDWAATETAPRRQALATFHSVWRKDADGTWRVLFDEGAGMRPATADDIAAFHAGRPARCPGG